MSELTLAALFALGLVAFLALFLVVVTYNRVVGLLQRVDKAWANVDVALKQRHDELPNLVNAVRGLMAYERDVLERVTALRAAYDDHAAIPRQAATSEATSSAVRQLFAVVERYPEIRSAGNVRELQDEIERLEELIADRRELYNDQVFRYNTAIATLPTVLVTGWFGWRPRPFFDAEEAAQRRPEVDLRAP
ncbi:MAG TPA: LemA family protein [Candidatus Limnocylindrales bacterium]|nr:LemA family protein [Candidatus Limnocylindrales bacterium]